MRYSRKQYNATVREVPLSGRKRAKDAANSYKFLATIEGVQEPDGAHIRGANGMRWRVA